MSGEFDPARGMSDPELPSEGSLHGGNPYSVDGELPEGSPQTTPTHEVVGVQSDASSTEKPKLIHPDKVPAMPARVINELIRNASTDSDPKVTALYKALENTSETYDKLDNLSRPSSLEHWARIRSASLSYMLMIGIVALTPGVAKSVGLPNDQTFYLMLGELLAASRAATYIYNNFWFRSKNAVKLGISKYGYSQRFSEMHNPEEIVSPKKYRAEMNELELKANALIELICNHYLDGGSGRIGNERSVMRQIQKEKRREESQRRSEKWEADQRERIENKRIQREQAVAAAHKERQGFLNDVQMEALASYIQDRPHQDIGGFGVGDNISIDDELNQPKRTNR